MAYKVGDSPVEGYTLESLLGTGSLGDSWKAVAPDGTPCVIKVFNLGSVSPKEMRFPRSLLQLKHPNLCPILGVWILDANGALLTDGSAESINISGKINARLVFATGFGQKTLAQRLQECRSRGIPLRELIRHMEDAARGLDYLHSPGEATPGLIHGNVKPSNLLLVGGLVQVCDFGLYRLDSSKGGTKTFAAGAPIYNSPESISEEAVKASDQYSLAITYYELRTGQLPFEESKALISNLTGVLDFSTLLEAEQRVLERATNKNPAKRYPTCSEMVTALQDAVSKSREWQKDANRDGQQSSSESSAASPAIPASAPPAPAPKPQPRPTPTPPAPSAVATGSFSDYPGMPGSGTVRSRAPERETPPPAPPAKPAKKKAAAEASTFSTPGSWQATPAEGIPRAQLGLETGKIEGQATVRYYSQMNPERLFPLMVAFSEKQLREIVEKSVRQAVSQTISVDDGSTLEVEPILPGCEVYPPLSRMVVSSERSAAGWSYNTTDVNPVADPARFYVLPKVLGRIEGARVIIRQDGQEIGDIPLDVKVTRQRWSIIIGLFGLVSPYLMMGLKALKIDPESQKQIGYKLYADAGEWVTSTIRPEWIVIVSVLVAVLLYFWCRPRQKSKFWDLETVS